MKEIPLVNPWTLSHKANTNGAALADRHYSRRSIGSPQFMPPGETIVLVGDRSVFGWWRPHPRSGIVAMNGLDGWTCSIFRNEGPFLSSELILWAETYVWDAKIRSSNPGTCFRRAGWRRRGRSADGKKTLLHKPWELRGRAQATLLDLARGNVPT